MHENSIALVRMVFIFIRKKLSQGFTLNEIEKLLVQRGFVNGEG